MKHGILLLAFFVSAQAHAALDLTTRLYCVTDLEGSNAEVLIRIEQKDGAFSVNDREAGKNLSADEGRLELNHSTGFFLRKESVRLALDLNTGTGLIEAKFDTGWVGGTTEKIKGTLSGCNYEGWPR